MIAAVIVLVTAVVFLALIEPQKSEKDQYKKFAGVYYAHRGLYSKDQSVPENSLAAFNLACEAGYGIELDIRLTKDGRVAVFHDDSLMRACGKDATVSELSYDELSQLSLFGTEQTIPLFSKVLHTVGGRVPLIVELKTSDNNAKELCEAAWKLLENYKGIYCIESFDPRAVAWFKKYHANVYRGQLIASYKKLLKSTSRASAFLLSHGMTNFMGRPHFIAHSDEKKTFPVSLCEWLGARKFVWTVSHIDSDYEIENDGVIFEFCSPKPKYYKEL